VIPRTAAALPNTLAHGCGATRPPHDTRTGHHGGPARTCGDGTLPAESCPAWPSDRPLRVLFVGNSQIDFWDLPRVVSSLSASAPSGCARIAGERFTRGGANLEDLRVEGDSRGRRLEDVLAEGAYDAVVLAESIDLVELRPPYPEQFEASARAIVEMVRAAGALPIFYATPYVETPTRTGFHEMADPQIALGAELDVPVAAGGLAWLRVWEERPEVDLYFDDRQHPGFHGSYVSALVIWRTITGGSPIGLTAAPDAACDDGPCAPISADQADVFQRAARQAAPPSRAD
jgi:hypothetical protein